MPEEHDSPVKVVDRRWWARGESGAAESAESSLKPTYVEELERKLAEKDKELKDVEAHNIRGGGGPSGGVNGDKSDKTTYQPA